MAAPSILALYDQYDFVPYEAYESWSGQGIALGCSLQRLQFPEGWASAFLHHLGATPDSHTSAMAYIFCGGV